MSKIHQPGHEEPTNNSKSCDTTKPQKECPICGEKSRSLPDHITNEHS